MARQSAREITGGGNPNTPRPRRVEEDEWAELMAERKGTAQPSSSLMKRPASEPPMINIKAQREQEEAER